jgi:hypothetical protein
MTSSLRSEIEKTFFEARSPVDIHDSAYWTNQLISKIDKDLDELKQERGMCVRTINKVKSRFYESIAPEPT